MLLNYRNGQMEIASRFNNVVKQPPHSRENSAQGRVVLCRKPEIETTLGATD